MLQGAVLKYVLEVCVQYKLLCGQRCYVGGGGCVCVGSGR